MKSILVTGGAGFVGSHLCRRLLNEGNNVICLDNMFTGCVSNVRDLLDNDNFKLLVGDVTDDYWVTEFIKKYDIHQIYNLACPASPKHYQLDPISTIKTSVFGILNMLDVARYFDATILQASTSEVYGDPIIHPQPESYRGNVNPIGIRACYDEGKRVAETILFDYNRQYYTDIKVVRIFNTYGPNMNDEDGRVVSNFITQALKGEDITIYGDGSQTRSFCYVDDLVDGLIKMMNSNITGPVNLGNPGEFTILELANKVIDMVGSESKLVYEPLPQDDPTQRKPVIDLAKKHLCWEPTINLDEGLSKTINYFKDLLL